MASRSREQAIHPPTRVITSAKDSPPSGAACGFSNQWETASGACARISARDRPPSGRNRNRAAMARLWRRA